VLPQAGAVSQTIESERGIVFGDAEELAFDHRTRHVLQKRISVNFNQTPLASVAETFQRQLGIPVTLDRRALEDAGAGADTEITLQCHNLVARDVLDRILTSLDLAWLPHRSYLLFSTPERASSELVTRVYPVADLVATPPSSQSYGAELDFDSIIELITTTIAPTTWDEVGGPGSIAPHVTAGAIVFNQTHDVHERAEQLLKSLRAAREAQGLRVYDYSTALENFSSHFALDRNSFSQRFSEPQINRLVKSAPAKGWRRPRVHE